MFNSLRFMAFIFAILTLNVSAATIGTWNANSQLGGTNNFGGTFANTTTPPAGLTVSASWTRGSGVTQSGSGAAHGWGGTNWVSTSSSAAVTAGQYVYFTISTNSSTSLSLSQIPTFNYRRSGTGPANADIYYSFDGSTWTTTGLSYSLSSTSSSGASVAGLPGTLSSVSALQSIGASKTVYIAIVPYGGSASGGSFYVYNVGGSTTLPDFEIDGTTSSVAGGPSITSSLTASGTYATAFTTYTITATNSPTSYGATGLPTGLSVNTSTGAITGTPTQAGSFSVSISASNASGTDTKTLVITIAPKALTVSAITVNSKTYTGTNAATYTGTLNGIYSTDVVTLNGTGTFATVNVANGIAVTSTATLGGANASGYTLTQPTGLSGNITQAPLTITPTAVSKVYGATLTGGTGSVAFSTSGLQNSETVGSVTIAYGTGSAATAVVGSYSGSVTISAATGGSFNPLNYSINYGVGAITVTAKGLTITANSTSKTYGQTLTFAGTEFTTTGLVNGDAVSSASITSTGAASTATVAGSPYSIVPASASGTGLGNYSITYTNGVLTVTKLGLTVTGATASGKTYDGTTSATITGATLVGVLAADAGNVTVGGGGTFASANVGTGIAVTAALTLGGPAGGNYSLTQPTGLTATISKANQTITFGVLAGKTTADADYSPGATSPSSGVNPITYTSSNTAVATIVSGNIHIVGVGTTNITASEAGSANYNAATDVVQPLTVTTPAFVSFDNFNRTAGNTVGIPSSGGSTSWTETETSGSGGATAEISINELFLTNTNSTGGAVGNGLEQVAFDMSSKYSTTFSLAPNAYNWVFNFRPTRSSPSGFSTTNTYGTATVLGCDQASFTASNANGYAVIVGNVGSPDPVKFVKFTGGLTSNSNVTDIATSSVTTENDYYSVKISYNPCTGQWALQVRDDGSSGFADPTTISSSTSTVTATDQTYTSTDLKYFGCLFQHGSSNGESVAWDNIYIPTTTTAVNTYTWNGGTGDYQVSTNWTPNRTCPQPNDVLLFTQATNVTTNVPTQTIGRLVVSTGSALTMRAQTGGTRTLSIQGGTGTDLDIPATSSFSIDCNDPLVVNILTGATASISGNFTFNNTIGAAGRDHRLLAADAGSVTFGPGAVCTAEKLTGNPFGSSGTANVVVFQSGSSYICRDGANPFGLTEPSSKVVFSTGSLYSHEQSGSPSLSSRTYADFQFNYNGANTMSIGGTGACSVDNFSVLQGSISFPLSANNLFLPVTVNGNFSVSAGASFIYDPTNSAAASTLSFSGSVGQTITNNGTMTLGQYSTLEIKNANNVTLNTNITTSGALALTTGQLITGSNAAIVAAGGTVSRTTGWVNGNLQKAIAASTSTQAFEIGDANYYAPVTLAFTGSTNGAGNITASTKSGIATQTQISISGLNAGKAADRIWTVTNSGVTSFTSADATLQYNTAEILGGANLNNFYIRRYNGSSWTPIPDVTPATNTANSPTSGQNTSKTTTTIPLVTFASGTTLNFVTGEAVSAYTWTGALGTDWAVPGNWTPTAPAGGPNSACAVDVIIPHVTNNPVVSSTVSVANMQIDANAQLTLNADINVCKNWVGGNGANAVVAGTGKVNLTGSTLQTISGKTAVQELLVNNPAGASMQTNSTMDVYAALDLETGNYDATNGVLTFKSNSVSSVGIINNFSAGYSGSLSGSIKAERYYAASGTYNQHYMGSPVNAPALSNFGVSGTPGFVTPTSNCDETKLAQHSAYGTVFSMDESHGGSCALSVWKVETSGNAQNGVGYSVLKSGAGTITLSGNANLASSYTISNLSNHGWTNSTSQGRSYRAGWQLVSNPYLATLNITTTNGGFDNQIQVWNANGPYAGTYQASNVIAPFQAFMVHMTNAGSGGTYTINASSRVVTAHTFYAQNVNQLSIVAENTETGLLDQTTIGFDAGATDDFDAQLDADKIPGALNRHTIYSVNNDKWLSKNILNSIATTSTVPVGFEPGVSGSYTLSFNGINTFDPTSYITLEDKKLNTFTDVRNGAYRFTADSADDWNRFVLHFTPPTAITTTNATCVSAGVIYIQQPGSANWNYVLTDSDNVVVASGMLNHSAPVTVAAVGGNYTLMLSDENNYVATKTISVMGGDMINAAFNSSATAIAQNGSITLTGTTSNAANYAWDFGNSSTATGQTVSATYTTPGAYTVQLTVSNASGCSSTTTQTITVTGDNTTGISKVDDKNGLRVYSNANKVYVDFSQMKNVDANVIIYNLLGQQLSSEHCTNNNIYEKEIDNIDAQYLIVSVKSDSEIITRKVFINGAKQ